MCLFGTRIRALTFQQPSGTANAPNVEQCMMVSLSKQVMSPCGPSVGQGDDNFDDIDASVVCRQLGFSTGRSLGSLAKNETRVKQVDVEEVFRASTVKKEI